MKWTWKIGRVQGIEIKVHLTLLLLMGWFALFNFIGGAHWANVLNNTLFIVTLFGIVVLHELGHALMAKRFNISTRDITLLPIGGVARLERMPEEPYKELLI